MVFLATHRSIVNLGHGSFVPIDLFKKNKTFKRPPIYIYIGGALFRCPQCQENTNDCVYACLMVVHIKTVGPRDHDHFKF